MAYARRSRKPAYQRRTRRRVPKSKQFTRRKRSYKRPARRALTMRKVINATSRKKKDTLPPSTGTAYQPGNTSPAGVQGGIGLPAVGYSMFAFMPTARVPQNTSVSEGSVSNSTQRTATQTFMVGYGEQRRIQTNSSHSWEMRTIAFYFKGPGLITPLTDFDTFGIGVLTRFDPTPTVDGGAVGYRRMLADLARQTGSGGTQNFELHNLFLRNMFRGTLGVDYQSPFQASINKDFITLVHDSRKIMRSGNDRGSVWETKKYFPMKRYLWYGDVEDGDHVDFNPFSAEVRKSMGDLYVVDFIAPAFGATENDSLIFSPQGTLYWHEK